MPSLTSPPKLWEPLHAAARETGISEHLLEVGAERGEIPIRLLRVGGSTRQRVFANVADLEAWRASLAQPLTR